MTLAAGTRLGAYEIQAALGAGGMGEVYRARDGKLGRDVAIKILPDRLTHDPERIARFRREAQVLASLNHPRIGAIYGLEETEQGRGTTASGQPAMVLVLELVEGATLAERIAEGPIPFEEALPIARQIAEALEAAHEKGIIHRDLKPANIKVPPDGNVKLLDFGLAKVHDVEGGALDLANSPTMMKSIPGMILGTAPYMAPEQANGREADRASDVWAFGCVLYEMLTGRRAFDGETVSEILAGILKTDPDWNRIILNWKPR